tara:strand:- start:189 stop:953 length:765 start_codon:yes stop_codon:yes gene_type:complete
MADLGGNFDANAVEPTRELAALPAGKYRAAIIGSEWKVNQAKDGRYVEMTIEILDPEFKKRRVWDRLNLENKSQQAVEISRGTLSAICRAVGVMNANDTSQLHNIPFNVSLKVEMYRGNPKNEVAGYESLESAMASAPVPGAPAPWEQPAVAPGGVAPAAPAVWEQPAPAPPAAPVAPAPVSAPAPVAVQDPVPNTAPQAWEQPVLPPPSEPQGVVQPTAPVPATAPQTVVQQPPIAAQPATAAAPVSEDEIPF